LRSRVLLSVNAEKPDETAKYFLFSAYTQGFFSDPARIAAKILAH
jgi:hypothetical protein